jgi:hypothetical protein
VELVHAYSNQLAVTFSLEKQLADARMHHRSNADPPIRHQRVERRLGHALISQIVEEYKEGASTPQLASRHKLGKGTLLRLLTERGVAVRRRGPA